MEQSFGEITELHDMIEGRKGDDVMEECGICFMYFNRKNIEIGHCGHAICHSCLREYIKALTEENVFYPITCPMEDCSKDIFPVYKTVLTPAEE
jgi:hypothetical protein